MKIFVAGASGAVGKRLVPLLVAAGHRVTATTRSPQKSDGLRAMGAEPIVLDGLDRDGVRQAILSARPDAVVHEMTALASMRSLKHFDDVFAVTNRLRTEGTRHLLEAAQAAGVRKFVAQSYAGWPSERRGGRVKTEADPFDPAPAKSMARTFAAIRTLEQLVLEAAGIEGTVLRYGGFYGPGTSIAEDGDVVKMVRRRQLPVIGGGAGVWSFLHVDDAACATQLALDRNAPGLYNIVDDEPAEVSVWVPELAHVIGAKPPMRLPAWIGRLAVGEAGIVMMTEVRGASNAKAKRALGWTPAYASWRDGFRRGLAANLPLPTPCRSA
jgi:nucleoside-diphosphate-sugar epimerase